MRAGIQLPELGGRVTGQAVCGTGDAGLALGVADRTGSRPRIVVVGDTVAEIGGSGGYLPHHGRVAGQARTVSPRHTGQAVDVAWLAVIVHAIVI